MRAIQALAGLALIGCAACSPSAETGQDVPAPAPTASQNQPMPVATLEGEWRVAGIDGEPFDEAYGLALSADATEIWWEPRCAGHIFHYRIDGLSFQARDLEPEPSPDWKPVDGPHPAVVCSIGLPPRLADVGRAIRGATTVERTPENGVLISGGGHSLLLFSQ